METMKMIKQLNDSTLLDINKNVAQNLLKTTYVCVQMIFYVI